MCFLTPAVGVILVLPFSHSLLCENKNNDFKHWQYLEAQVNIFLLFTFLFPWCCRQHPNINLTANPSIISLIDPKRCVFCFIVRKSFCPFVLRYFPLQTFLDSVYLLRDNLYAKDIILIIFSFHNKSRLYDRDSPHFLCICNASLATGFPLAHLLFYILLLKVELSYLSFFWMWFCAVACLSCLHDSLRAADTLSPLNFFCEWQGDLVSLNPTDRFQLHRPSCFCSIQRDRSLSAYWSLLLTSGMALSLSCPSTTLAALSQALLLNRRPHH